MQIENGLLGLCVTERIGAVSYSPQGGRVPGRQVPRRPGGAATWFIRDNFRI